MKITINKPKWIKSIDFWRLDFIHKKAFDAIILVKHNGKNVELGDGYECLHIFRFTKKGNIAINCTLDKFAFDTFNPERNYDKIMVLEYEN